MKQLFMKSQEDVLRIMILCEESWIIMKSHVFHDESCRIMDNHEESRRLMNHHEQSGSNSS